MTNIEKKQNILNSWIMVEFLSEGDINKKDKQLLGFDEMNDDDYYFFLKKKLSKISGSKKGIAIYFNIFDFLETIKFLRNKYGLPTPEEEKNYGEKFSLALFFDKDLNLLNDSTFFTASYFMKNTKKIPSLEEFLEYEKKQKSKLGQYFEIKNNDTAKTDVANKHDKISGVRHVITPMKFNEAIKKVFQLFKEPIKREDCRINVSQNIESDTVLFHSFFVQDLEKAKKISTQNLDKYLLSSLTDCSKKTRINLDSKNLGSENEPNILNRKILAEILQPENYPLGRFPSETKFALSFMQQIAVNLSIGFDNSQIRSVNGPPGTGKTTLLKDIFAELIVKQSYDICILSQKKISGTEDTRYYDKASIGVIPEHITENSIIVASSNNGAVQNIVNELPLSGGIASSLLDELKSIDYFYELANSSVESEWKEGKEYLHITPKEKVFWGLFSLEGGSIDNMKNILSYVKAIVQYFEGEEYDSNPDIYERFKKQYQDAIDYRRNIQRLSSFYQQNDKDKEEKVILTLRLSEIQKLIDVKNESYDICIENLRKLKSDKHKILRIFAKRNIKSQLKQISQEQQDLEKQKSDYIRQIDDIEMKIKKRNDELEKKIEEKSAILGKDFKPLDFNQPYDALQLSNPWFETDELYRIIQSRLFIAALGVRKQFLYDNRKNIKAAINIWNHQKDYLERKQVIHAAWEWINMSIPVISSTFASFGKMCRNLEPDSLGHLFIDEAGQALPQASVGAIFRNRHVMVVGDPAQIKPVYTLDSGVINLLGKHFNVSEKYLSESASTQTLVDSASQYGYYRDKDQSDSSWIGIPLWVHRRCKNPMFSISNKISYNGMMVQGADENKRKGKTGWFDVKGKAKDKYVEEQGELLSKIIQKMIEDNPKIIDKEEKDIIYVISPFSNVAYQLANQLHKINFTRYDKNSKKPTNVGTIHTFQGKEAPVVFMVLGADAQSKGAAIWAVSEPNMMNVAATRAKEEFYIIGDKELYLSLGCDVIKDTNDVIVQYKKENKNQELVLDVDNFKLSETNNDSQKNENINSHANRVSSVENLSFESNSKAQPDDTHTKIKSIMYIGNRRNNSFHYSTCQYAPRNPAKRVEFRSREEALNNGFSPCNTCKA